MTQRLTEKQMGALRALIKVLADYNIEITSHVEYTVNDAGELDGRKGVTYFLIDVLNEGRDFDCFVEVEGAVNEGSIAYILGENEEGA